MVASADAYDALAFKQFTFYPKENENGAKTPKFSCNVIKSYHICHLIFLPVPVFPCIGKRER